MTSLTVTRIGHACQLIEIGDRRILTDPWFTQTATYYQGERILPLIGPGTVATLAKDKGFRDVRAIEAWDATVVDDVTVTAAPGKHGVHEITFVIQSGGRTVYFGGDSLRVPELDTIPERFGAIDLAILPTNGLCIRPMNLQQVVMDAEEAAGLTAVLRPTVAVAQHYAFHSGRLGDRMITKGDQDPRHYADAVARLAPEVDVRLVLPGVPVTVR